LSDITRCIGEPDSAPDASHKLVHLDVLRPEHTAVVVVMASAYVSRKLTERAATQQSPWVQDIVNVSASEPAFRAAAGALFEVYAHRRLQQGGSFTVCGSVVQGL
jgi:hypothetical protein